MNALAKNNHNRRELPPPLAEFAHINRYWDKTRDMPAAKILPGQLYVTLKDELITTVLGSCVAACIRDRRLGIGGMNHFMLPEGGVEGAGDAARYGVFAMESLINAILKNGGRRAHLEVKLFGGGQVMSGMSDVGRRNIQFARSFVRSEGLEVTAEDLGGPWPRKVVYFPASGKVLVKKLESLHNDTLVARERSYYQDLNQGPVAGDIELFD